MIRLSRRPPRKFHNNEPQSRTHMKTRITLALIAGIAISTSAMADAGGAGGGPNGPQYPAQSLPSASHVSRAQVQADLAKAVADGSLAAEQRAEKH
jgi:hypothetical protein